MIRDRRRQAESALDAARQALGSPDRSGLPDCLEAVFDATTGSDDRVLLTQHGHGLALAGLGWMAAGRSAPAADSLRAACETLLSLPSDADALGLAHAIGEGSNRIYRREAHLHLDFDAIGLFEGVLAAVLDALSTPVQAPLVKRLGTLAPPDSEGLRILLGWLAFSAGLVATDQQRSGDALRFYLQSLRLIEGLRHCPEACFALTQVVLPGLEFERLRLGDAEGARRARQRCTALLEQVGVPTEARARFAGMLADIERLAAGESDPQAPSAIARRMSAGTAWQPAKQMMQAAASDPAARRDAMLAMADAIGGPGRQMPALLAGCRHAPGSAASFTALIPLGFGNDAQVAWRAFAHLGLVLGPPVSAWPSLAILFGKLAMRTLQELRLNLAHQAFRQLDPFADETAVKAAEVLQNHLRDSGRLGEALRLADLLDAERGLPAPDLADPRWLVDAGCPLTVAEAEAVAGWRAALAGSSGTVPAIDCDLLEARLGVAPLPVAATTQGDGVHLPPDAALLAVIVAGPVVKATLSGRFGTRSENVRLTIGRLNAVVFDALQALLRHEGRGALPALQALHEALVAPFLPTLKHAGVRVLVVQTAGSLRRLPFGVLHDGRRYLIEDLAIVAHPASIPLAPGRGLTAPVRAVSIAVSEAPALKALPGVLLDARALADCLDRSGLGSVRSLVDAQADAAGVEALLRTRPSLLHVSSHFEVVQADAGRSAFVWAAGGRYTLAQLARQDLASVDLALMLGCETQSISEVAGTLGITAIDSLLLRMGVGAVVGAAWSVRDDLSHAMLRHFLAQVFDHGLDLAQALRQAVLRVARDPVDGTMEPPGNWGAFELAGGAWAALQHD